MDEALARHERFFPGGADAGPLRAAARWLADRIPPEDTPDRGAEAFGLIQALVAGEVDEPFLRARPDLCRRIASALARRFLETARVHGLALAEPLGRGLPWGVFGLWSGDLSTAHQALQRTLEARPAEPLPWLALGDVLYRMGRLEAARAAYREGYGLAPLGAHWPVEDPAVGKMRADLGADPLWAGAWWAVGAYEEGGFPRYGRLPIRELRAREERLRGLARQGCTAEAFFQGLAVSEAGVAVDTDLCARVRRTMRALNPGAFERHMARLGGSG